jgi:hypothetical protein
VGEDLEEEDRIPHAKEPGVDEELSAEGCPEFPRAIVGVGT